MAAIRRNLVFTKENYQWVKSKAPHEKGLSQIINTLIERERSAHGLVDRLEAAVAELGALVQEAMQTPIIPDVEVDPVTGGIVFMAPHDPEEHDHLPPSMDLSELYATASINQGAAWVVFSTCQNCHEECELPIKGKE